ncbi:MAG TPA: hypothetical protein VGP79_09645 [Bryobacteraceae bacterium]|jgi:hypothetical protein|nr:hypothetical protein [Bryobacteraceae bacterium]
MRKIFAVTLLSVAAFATQAMAATNFSGEWKLNLSKSDYGPVPAPETMERSIQQTDTTITSKTHQKGAQGETRTETKYTLDGKECINTAGGSTSKGTAKMEGDKLIIESVRDFQGTELKSKETWSLSGGGKVLTINNHIMVQGQELDLVVVLDKQ